MIFKGLGVALVTPFINNEVNYLKLEELIEFQIASNSDALIILGTTAENVTLSDEEKTNIIKHSISTVNKRIPVIVGTGSCDTRKVIYESMKAKELGADGLLIVTPYYNKPSDEGLYEHYKLIARSVDLPIILYNVPSRTATNLSIDVIKKLAKEKNIVGIKEASGDLFKVSKLFREIDNENFCIYSGNDDSTLDFLKLGASGVISVSANIIPVRVKEVIDLFFNGRFNEAEEEFNKLRNLNQILFIETNPVPVKAALNLLGYDVGDVRLPLVNLNKKNMDLLRLCLNDLGLRCKL